MKVSKAIPNLLTILRILLCPVTVLTLLRHQYLPALGLYLALALTDCFDGYLARRLSAVSKFGAMLDQVSDKIVTLTILSTLMVIGVCPSWFVGLVISVGLFQAIGYFIYHQALGTRDIETLKIGKWNMALQYGWMALMIASLLLPSPLATSDAIFWTRFTGYSILGMLQVAVFFSYFFHLRVHMSPDLRALFPAKR